MKDLRELSNREIDQVSGGIAPLVFLVLIILTSSQIGSDKKKDDKKEKKEE